MNFIALPNSISLFIAHAARIKKAVQTVKRLIKKSIHDGNLHLEYQNTPWSDIIGCITLNKKVDKNTCTHFSTAKTIDPNIEQKDLNQSQQ